ncbi:hypothetical protein F4802DRAFT_611215 [Xylaria palmicola]|nr:hypothetical protein F4802DRAFT_611215 [Xylaria palmicola]
MKIMEEKYGFKATHQLGEKWGWRKYNQGGMKLPPARARKSRPPNNSSDSQEDEIIVASGAPEVLGRDIGSLRASLSALLTDQRQDEKTMRALKRANPDDIARCIRLCFRWCEKEIDVDEAQLPFPYGGAMDAEADDTHTPDSKYECDARIFVYLLDRYISSATSPDRDGDWDALTRALVGLCPLKALFTMSTLIMTVVGNTLDACRDETSLAAPAAAAAAAGLGDEFDVARLGLREIGRRGWGDEKLAAEFCDEFEAILDDYAAYGDAVVAAVRDYVAHTWPEGREAGAGGQVPNGYHFLQEWVGPLQ